MFAFSSSVRAERADQEYSQGKKTEHSKADQIYEQMSSGVQLPESRAMPGRTAGWAVTGRNHDKKNVNVNRFGCNGSVRGLGDR